MIKLIMLLIIVCRKLGIEQNYTSPYKIHGANDHYVYLCKHYQSKFWFNHNLVKLKFLMDGSYFIFDFNISLYQTV